LQACQSDPPFIDGQQVSVSMAKPAQRAEDRPARGSYSRVDRGAYSRSYNDRAAPRMMDGSGGARYAGGGYERWDGYDDYYSMQRSLPAQRGGYERRATHRSEYADYDRYPVPRERERSQSRYADPDAQRWDGNYDDGYGYDAAPPRAAPERRGYGGASAMDDRRGSMAMPAMPRSGGAQGYGYAAPAPRGYGGREDRSSRPTTGGYGSSRGAGGGYGGGGGGSTATRGYGSSGSGYGSGAAGRAPPPARYSSGSRYGPY
jgi:hypothetical protein